MLDGMRRLQSRGAPGCGIVVDEEGAAFGPDHVLVHSTGQVYRSIARDDAARLQGAFTHASDPDRLFRQCQRIEAALNDGGLALAQILALQIPLRDFGRPPSAEARPLGGPFVKAGYNPDEPRIPAGNPGGGEWTTGGSSSTLHGYAVATRNRNELCVSDGRG